VKMPKVNRFFYFITLILVVTSFTAQNLVPNPGFENYTTCPNFGGEINYCSNWNNVNLVYGVFTVGTPDYFNTCSTANCCPPNTFAGQCNPHSGNAMIATVLYDSPIVDYREYVSTQLTCPMVTGNTYTVSFWLTNGLNPISPYIIKNIGACFSNTPLTQSGWNLISVTPQVELTTLIGSTSWVQYSFTVTPTSNWQYLTLGSFRTDLQNTPTLTYSITTGNPSVYANYFWDDIEVIGPSGPTTISVNGNNTVCTGNTTTLTASGSTSYTWSTGATTASVALTPNVTTTYTVMSNANNCINPAVITVSVIPNPNVTISGNNTICNNQSIILTAGGADTYTWSTGTNTSSITVNPTSLSSYTVIGTTSTCTNQAVATVNVMPSSPNVTINGSNTICPGQNITLTADGASTYTWNTGATAASIVLNPTVSTTYTVTGGIGTCTSQAVAVIVVDGVFNFTLPNIITPNNDGINDFIDFGKYQFSTMQLQIYNRWGIRIYESNDPSSIWRPITIDDGTYFYIIQYTITCNEEIQGKTLKGFITSIK